MAKILIVENSIELREALVDLLELEGYTALWTASETAAWEKINSSSVDLILQDLSLGDETRFTLLSRVRQNPPSANVPVIFLTHYITQATAIRGRELGATGFLVKPFETRELLDLVRRCTMMHKDIKFPRQFRPNWKPSALSVSRNLGNHR